MLSFSSAPPKTTKEKNEEKAKKKEEALKLKKKTETKILKSFGVSGNKKLSTKKSSKQHPLPAINSTPLRLEIPFLTELSIMEALARPIQGSPLNPVTDMTLVPLTIVNLHPHLAIPVLDLDLSTRIS